MTSADLIAVLGEFGPALSIMLAVSIALKMTDWVIRGALGVFRVR